MQRKGFDVLRVESPDRATTVLLAVQFDLIVADSLVGDDALQEFMTWLRTWDSSNSVPVLVIGSPAMSVHLRPGVDRLIRRPFRPAELRRMVMQMIESQDAAG